MAQVTRTTNDLITNSLYLTGELGVGEVADAFMLSTGLELINELLDKFASDSIYVPYLTTFNFTMVPNQGSYTVSDMIPSDITEDQIIDLAFANYTVEGQITYPLKVINKATYYGIVRLNTLATRPGFIFLNKQPLQSVLTLYPLPDRPYPCEIQAKVMLNKLEAQDNLSSMPPNAYGFLKYALGRKFLAYYPSANWPQTNEDEYQDYYKAFKSTNETDLTLRPSLILEMQRPSYWWTNILAL